MRRAGLLGRLQCRAQHVHHTPPRPRGRDGGAHSSDESPTDDASERALTELTADGSTVSETIRRALVDAVLLHRRGLMRAESSRLRDDAEDLVESRRVRADMNALRAW